MKKTTREFGHDYATFRFGYYTFAEFEKGDELAEFYDQGFLPYSLDPSIRGSFYMARSGRVPLTDFALTSENRRVAKRFDNTLTVKEMLAKDMSAEIKALILDYFAKRHGEAIMPAKRLESIITSPLTPNVIVYESDGEPLAAVLEVSRQSFAHFWYSAYDLSLTNQSLGMWLILDRARAARERDLTHYYIGTVYGPKALYKTNLEPFEFWDGTTWNGDLKQLKALARAETK